MVGPGDYVADSTEGISRVEDLPQARVERRSRDGRRRRCPFCGGKARRYGSAVRVLHDLGDARGDRPLDIHLTYSKHQCLSCRRCFAAEMDDLALPHCHYTHRVQQRAVRLVIEDGLPYRTASWHLWRDHRVFVPFATIQNWVEAAGKKKPSPHRNRISRQGPGQVQRLSGGRRSLRRAVLRAGDRGQSHLPAPGLPGAGA